MKYNSMVISCRLVIAQFLANHSQILCLWSLLEAQPVGKVSRRQFFKHLLASTPFNSLSIYKQCVSKSLGHRFRDQRVKGAYHPSLIQLEGILICFINK